LNLGELPVDVHNWLREVGWSLTHRVSGDALTVLHTVLTDWTT
jgi:hypothetical protein